MHYYVISFNSNHCISLENLAPLPLWQSPNSMITFCDIFPWISMYPNVSLDKGCVHSCWRCREPQMHSEVTFGSQIDTFPHQCFSGFSYWFSSKMETFELNRYADLYHLIKIPCVLQSSEINGLVQERRNSIANALELRLSCTNLSKWYKMEMHFYYVSTKYPTPKFLKSYLVATGASILLSAVGQLTMWAGMLWLCRYSAVRTVPNSCKI